ncbi:MAG: peptidoglycan bridge formation glycyltransferase FemA/FemB family protein [Candidatus Rokubacteria bacterium]|nr:peptidoglycan bridge formation glycyltransferase FemA/FemB family protein [Candidatus Rokubacteria bacterium]
MAGAGEWSAIVAQARDRNVVQSPAWAQYKRGHGWEPERWVALDGSGKPVCAMQTLAKRAPLGQSIVWVPGGPLAGFPDADPAMLGKIVTSWLDIARREHRLRYVRFYSHLPHDAEAAFALGNFAIRPRVPLNTGYTVHVDLSTELEDLRSAMTAKHRYYVKQSEAARLTWRWGRGDDLLRDAVTLHAEIAHVKKMPRLNGDFEAARHLAAAFEDDYIVLVGYHGDQPLTACSILTFGDSAFYFRAATGAAGRRVSAAYAMVMQLFAVLKARGIARFDFGGIAPRSPQAAGVDHFKGGFGGDVVEYLGEWEWPMSGLARWLMNYVARSAAS